MTTNKIRDRLSRNDSEQNTARAGGWYRSLRLLLKEERKLEQDLAEAIEAESLKQGLENCF
jgi:hypothetical protein